MIPLKRALSSPVGRKFVMSLSGIALVLFVIVHLLGNLTLFFPGEDGENFNDYAAFFADLGPVLYIIELGLLVVIVVHMAWGISTWLKNRNARPENYGTGQQSKGGPSNLSLLSKNMIFTGGTLGIFLIVHLWHFRVRKEMGSVKEEYGTYETAGGREVADLYAMVEGSFSSPGWVIFYVASMFFLGFHLRHGFWSALQSLGAMKPEWSKGIYAIGLVVAVILAVGFMGIPIWMFIEAN